MADSKFCTLSSDETPLLCREVLLDLVRCLGIGGVMQSVGMPNSAEEDYREVSDSGQRRVETRTETREHVKARQVNGLFAMYGAQLVRR
jgi:hypothetical protein